MEVFILYLVLGHYQVQNHLNLLNTNEFLMDSLSQWFSTGAVGHF